MTKCSAPTVPCKFGSLTGGHRRVEQITFSFGDQVKPTLLFDAEHITSDAGLAPFREIDERLGLTDLAASWLDDEREAEMTVHPLRRLVRETVYAQAAGYEDANDHTPLVDDPWFQQIIGRIHEQSVNPKKHDGLASEATLSRLLNGHKLGGRDGFGRAHLEQFARVMGRTQPSVLTLDIDGYDAQVHGWQQLGLFNTHYGHNMFYPLHVSVAEYGFVVGALLREGTAGANTDAVQMLEPILEFLSARFPNTRLRLRADSGFMEPALYRLCERFGVEYAVRLKMNAVLKRLFERHLTPRVKRKRPDAIREGQWIFYHDTTYKAGSWKKSRRILLKRVYDPATGESEQCVIVTNMRKSAQNAWNFYQHRGQCEQRIDELKNHLRGEKFSCPNFHANAFKLHLMVIAYNLFAAARIFLPANHELKRATVATWRVTIIKCGAMLRRTARRLWVHASRYFPHRELLADVSRRFANARLRPTPVWDTG